MKVVSSSQMRLIESRDINEGRYSPQDYAVLVAQALQNHVVADETQNVLILCGDNDNGNYGLMLAYLLLKNSHLTPRIIYHGSKENSYYQLVIQNGLEVIDNPRLMMAAINESSYVVDCLFGSELDEMISYPDNYIINWVNEADCFVLSCDLPSGLDGNDGTLYGCCIKADRTMTIELPKLGLFLEPGCEYVGELVVQPVGLSYDAIGSISSSYATLDESQMKQQVKKMNSHSSVLLFAGSQLKTSGYLLSCESLLACGADRITVAGDQRICDMAANHLYEVETIRLEDNNLTGILKDIDYGSYDLIVYAGGFSRGQITVEKLMETNRPILFTPSGINDLKTQSQLLERRATTVLMLDKNTYEEFFGTISPSSFLDEAIGTSRRYADLKILYRSTNALAIDKDGVLISHDSPLLDHRAGLMDVLVGTLAALLAQNNESLAISCANELCYRGIESHRKESHRYALSARALVEVVSQQLYQLDK